VSEDGLTTGEDGLTRCWWSTSAPEYLDYHDREWGFPVSAEYRLFEKLSLEGFQAGLSWLTILRKRPAFRAAFADFDYTKVANFDDDDVGRLLADPGIVRHRGKIEAVINNAQRATELAQTEGALAAYVWGFEPQPPRRADRFDRAALAAATTSAESTALAKDLKRRGWRFVGPTTVYAFMQAMGLVNDHLDGCHAKPEVDAARASFTPP
jgi:DNA-3-methyladenine glycosylase I